MFTNTSLKTKTTNFTVSFLHWAVTTGALGVYWWHDWCHDYIIIMSTITVHSLGEKKKQSPKRIIINKCCFITIIGRKLVLTSTLVSSSFKRTTAEMLDDPEPEAETVNPEEAVTVNPELIL